MPLLVICSKCNHQVAASPKTARYYMDIHMRQSHGHEENPYLVERYEIKISRDELEDLFWARDKFNLPVTVIC